MSLKSVSERRKKKDTDLGHGGYEGLLKTTWQDWEFWCPYLNHCQVDILMCDKLSWNESCCFLWPPCKHFNVTGQVSVTISVGQSPHRGYYAFERFIVMLFLEGVFISRMIQIHSFDIFHVLWSKTNKLAPGCRTKYVAYSQPMHKYILLMYLCVLLIYVDLWFLKVQYVGEFLFVFASG